MLGRSKGGAVTLSAVVVAPTVVRAAVVFASTSSLFLDNFRRWDLPERAGSANAVYRRFGTPEEEPDFYRDLSPRTFFDRVEVPILAHHGTRDDSCPSQRARSTHAALEKADVSSELQVYQGEGTRSNRAGTLRSTGRCGFCADISTRECRPDPAT